MNDKELLTALKKIGPEDRHRCLGCGYEHHCTTHGCAVTRAAAERIEALRAELDILRTRRETDQPLTSEERREMALYEAAVKKFGKELQILVAVEETSELSKALLKYTRSLDSGQGDAEAILENINEERADVAIMLSQLEVIFGDNAEAEAEKLDHLADLVELPRL